MSENKTPGWYLLLDLLFKWLAVVLLFAIAYNLHEMNQL